MKIKMLTLILYTSILFAQEKSSTSSTGDYEMDLGQIYGAIQSVKFMEEICSEQFQEQQVINENTYKKWRKTYLSFIQEIEKYYNAMMWFESGENTEKHMKLLIDSKKSFELYKKNLQSQMSSEGNETFKNQCKLYSDYLNSDRMNLEKYYAEQIETIRKRNK